MKNPWAGLRGLPAAVWVLALAVLVNRAGTMVLPFLVLYVSRGLHFTEATAGAALALYGGCSLGASFAAGWIADRIGPARVMLGSLFFTGVTLLLFPLFTTKAGLFAATAAFSIFAECFRPASLSFLSGAATPASRKQAFSLIRLAINLGMSVGPAAGGFLAAWSFRSLFWVDGLTSLAAAAILLFWGTRTALPAPAPPMAATAPSAAPFGSALTDPLFLFFLLSVLPVSIVFFQMESALPLYLVGRLALSERVYGSMFTINTLLIVAIEVPMNGMTAAWRHRRTLSMGALLCAIGFGVLVFSPLAPLPVVVLSTVLWTFGEMNLFPTLSSYVAEIAPESRRGEYMGAYTMTFGAAFSLGPWLGTVILHRFGGAVLWPAAFAAGLVSVLMMAALPERRPSKG